MILVFSATAIDSAFLFQIANGRPAWPPGTMTRSKTVPAAEKKALEGENESQDSQAMFDAYKLQFGVGVVS